MGDTTLSKTLNQRPPEIPSDLSYPVVLWIQELHILYRMAYSSQPNKQDGFFLQTLPCFYPQSMTTPATMAPQCAHCIFAQGQGSVCNHAAKSP